MIFNAHFETLFSLRFQAAKILNLDIIVGEFKIQSRNYLNNLTITLEKGVLVV